MPKKGAPPLTEEKAQMCRRLVYAAAKRFKVPPAYITAHVRNPQADLARRAVCKAMVRMGLRRWQVADIFMRDLRRVRASVLADAPVLQLPRKLAPAIPVGTQLVWKFAVMTNPAPVRPISAARFFRPVPPEMREALPPDERKRLARFFEEQAAALR